MRSIIARGLTSVRSNSPITQKVREEQRQPKLCYVSIVLLRNQKKHTQKESGGTRTESKSLESRSKFLFTHTSYPPVEEQL
jgi:hypothetical protein